MTVGSVRGKLRLLIPRRVGQGERSAGVEAASEGGQTRFMPALTDIVG